MNQLRTAVQGVSGSWGLLTFSFIAAYVFGREYKEGTEKNMLTVPIRREYSVIAKMIVVACWVFGLALFAFVLQAGGIAAMQARIKSLGASAGPEICTATRLYILEVVKARAVTAKCRRTRTQSRPSGRRRGAHQRGDRRTL